MDIKDFIKEALTQIAEGVNVTNRHIKLTFTGNLYFCTQNSNPQ